MKIPKELNEDLKDLLRRMLEKNPDARIKIKELRDHDWLTLHGHDPLPSTDVNVSNLAEVTERAFCQLFLICHDEPANTSPLW